MFMFNNSMQSGLVIRPSNGRDKPFLMNLYNSTRDDLKHVDGSNDFIEELIEMQFKAQFEGYGEQFPNAFYFVIEKQQEKIGRIAVDFGHNEVRIIDIAFIKAARNKGYGSVVINALKSAAEQNKVPLTLTVLSSNISAIKLYQKLGFKIIDNKLPHSLMMWLPESKTARFTIKPSHIELSN
jgi:ribosomal protein S18 acetylase RimI-like enzyme